MASIRIPGVLDYTKPGKLVCIGRNYALHAAEMGSDIPEEPMIFLKPSSAIIGTGDSIILPPQSSDVHHEVELVIAIGKRVKNIQASDSSTCVAGFAVGLDMTARDLQAKAKKQGHPWSVAKGFDTFAPLGEFVSADDIVDPQNLTITLDVNGERKQEGYTGDMIFTVAELVAACSRIFILEPGDLIYSGTPSGVGPVARGDELCARIGGLPELCVTVC